MFGILAYIVLNQENRIVIRRQEMVKKKIIRDVFNPFEIGDEVFKLHYRMYPHVALELTNLVQEHLPNAPQGMPLHLQVLSVLRFLADGSYQKGSAADINHPMSQSSFSRYLHHVIFAINLLAPLFIKFPNSAEERAAIQTRFQERIGFPGVLGAVDCTLPKIVAPPDHEEAYLNYKRQHSLTLQIVADIDYKILGTRICSGSTNDRFVWNWSDIRLHMLQLRANQHIVQNEGLFYIIGDGGYSPSPIMLTPIQRAARGSPEYAFSDALRRTRVIVENVFGIVKARWRCLNKLRGLHYDPRTAAEIVQACTVLHNYLRNHGMPVELLEVNNYVEEDVNRNNNDEDEFVYFNDNDYVMGLAERQRIINMYCLQPRV